MSVKKIASFKTDHLAAECILLCTRHNVIVVSETLLLEHALGYVRMFVTVIRETM